MKTDHDMPRLWLDVWTEKTCIPGAARLDPPHAVWRSYWKFCARHGRAPLPVERWAIAVCAATAGAVQAVEYEGEVYLLSESREVVREALQTAMKPKTNNRTRRKVSR